LLFAPLLVVGCSDDAQSNRDAATSLDAAMDAGDGPKDGASDAVGADAGADLVSDARRDVSTDQAQPPDAAADQSADTTPPQPTVRVATFNAYCFKDNPAARLDGIADEIVRLGLDAVGLQEICETPGKNDNFADQLIAKLNAKTQKSWERRWSKTHFAWDTWDEGVAIVAPAGHFVASGDKTLSKGSGFFPRKVIWARLKSPAGEFLFYATHLTVSRTSADRDQQVKEIVALVDTHQSLGLPRVVVGDFNTVATSNAIGLMKLGTAQASFVDAAAKVGNIERTCCAPTFRNRIDYVFAEDTVTIKDAHVSFIGTVAQQLSDHRGVSATLGW
jgi:endonuclease/exonuclease/phosphatase family metal-dependent hydrolase